MKYKKTVFKILSWAIFIVFASCGENNNSNHKMINLLSAVAKSENTIQNTFCPAVHIQLAFYDSILNNTKNYERAIAAYYHKANAFLSFGDEQQSVTVFEDLLKRLRPADISHIKLARRDLAIAYLRLGERMNCINNHGAQSCVFPIEGAGVHNDKTGSLKAIAV